MCFRQAHDIIVVELAPPPPRETNEEEADAAVDADASVAAVVPKVAEKKKVIRKQFVMRLCRVCHHIALSCISSGTRIAEHSAHQEGTRARLHGSLLAGGNPCRPQVMLVRARRSSHCFKSVSIGLWLAKAFRNLTYPRHAFISGRDTPRCRPSQRAAPAFR
jgi:hypothetical protein